MTTRCDVSGIGSDRTSVRSGRRHNLLNALVMKVQEYAEFRRQRRALMSLDDHMLKDIGVSRAEVARIVGKDFDWSDR